MSLFEDQTYENLLANAMARVSSTFDKREGSMVYNGVAPSMAELAQLYKHTLDLCNRLHLERCQSGGKRHGA